MITISYGSSFERTLKKENRIQRKSREKALTTVKKKNLKCFVAMRIGEKDTNQFYSQLIRPTLKRIGIDARHVDDEEHNENIDDRIIKLLNKRDLVIADLTYARPSVYFEAGYAEAKDKPVVYTCRKDHFKGVKNGEYGELKVHFDLQMKNIIPWYGPMDKGFAKKLRKRVNYVVKHLRLRQVQVRKQERDEEQFSKLPLRTKEARVRNLCIKTAVSNGFRGTSTEDPALYKWLGISELKRPSDRSLNVLINRIQTLKWIGTKQRAGVLYTLHFVIVSNFMKNNMTWLYKDALHTPVCNLSTLVNSKMHHRELREHFIICSFGGVDLTKFSNFLSTYSIQRDGKKASITTSIEIPWGRYMKYRQIFALGSDTYAGNKNGKLDMIKSFLLNNLPYLHNIKRHITISLIDSIKSVPDFTKRLERILSILN